MPDSRFVTFQFCDDVRQEVGNKFSLMGCYSTKMFVASFPATLPKFCLQAKIHSPIDLPFNDKIVVRLMQGDQALAELSADLQRTTQPEPPSWARWHVLSVVMIASPFAIEGPCRLRVEAESGDEKVVSGYFAIEATPQTPQVVAERSETS